MMANEGFSVVAPTSTEQPFSTRAAAHALRLLEAVDLVEERKVESP